MAEEKNYSVSEKVELDGSEEYNKEAGFEDSFSDIEEDINSAMARQFQKIWAAEVVRGVKFRSQLTPDEIREDFESITGAPVQLHKRKKRSMTKSEKLKYEMRFPGSQLEKLLNQQVPKEKPKKKKGARWSCK